jgi:hypothetical protein
VRLARARLQLRAHVGDHPARTQPPDHAPRERVLARAGHDLPRTPEDDAPDHARHEQHDHGGQLDRDRDHVEQHERDEHRHHDRGDDQQDRAHDPEVVAPAEAEIREAEAGIPHVHAPETRAAREPAAADPPLPSVGAAHSHGS